MTINIKTKNEQVDEAIILITDTFGGADGGASFVKLNFFYQDMANRSNEGDVAADKIINIALQFAKIIKLANGDTC